MRMGRALLIVGLLATLGFIASAALGYGLRGTADSGMPRHVLVALASSLLVLFSHCWILFYLAGTGRAIRGAVRSSGLDPALARETGRLKAASYPWLLLASALVVATFVLGCGVATTSVKPIVHHVLFYAALAAQGYALWVERRVLDANERLLADVDERLVALPATA
jgi:RsiW-degrading membrane proteinase PrsW (M82 family)